jgi:hypothetical protein
MFRVMTVDVRVKTVESAPHPSGVASPACSAIVQQFVRRTPDSRPSTNARARHHPGEPPRQIVELLPPSGGSTLSSAATVGLS